jgi:hypothetical protein
MCLRPFDAALYHRGERAKSLVVRPHCALLKRKDILYATVVLDASVKIHNGHALKRLNSFSYRCTDQAFLVGVGLRDTPAQDVHLVRRSNRRLLLFPYVE